MTSSPPDISSLTLNASHGRLHDSSYDFDGSTAPRAQYHFATSTGIPAQTQYPPLGVGQSPLKNKPAARSGLPAQWLDNSDNRSLSPQNNSDFSSAGGSPPPISHVPSAPVAAPSPSQNLDEEIIPTAIVIKNIPFNVKRETLLDIIASLAIPTPYAFNYHLDQQGSFRGLAFANFRQAADADAVVAALNGFDVQGRKLRVEYKKVLQAGEKERIEREKAIRRMRSMQLEKEQIGGGYEDYGSPIPSQYTPQRSYSGTAYQPQQYSPTNVSAMPQYNHVLASTPGAAPQNPIVPSPPSTSDKGSANELDLNDPATLEIYSRILLFKDDRMRDELAFSRTLSPKQRRVVHLVAQKLGVYHYSVGEGEERYAVVTRIDPARQQQQRPPHTLSRAPSAYLAQQASQSAVQQSLRVKKSMPDMKTLPSQAPRLNPRSSNGNIREGYATISTPRRQSAGFSLFSSNGGPFGGVPPVPSVPMAGSLSSGHEVPGGVVRQPRGPGAGGFGRRDSRVGLNDPNSSSATRARSDSLEGADGRGN
uniref:R3h domain n=1 Tax=Mycena chlorophos TaxID=658473 RepID=A0ABQ0LWM8_MYCCL|nr:r3h domain [Mycena chlorophos]